MSQTAVPFHNFTDAVPKLRDVLSKGLVSGVGVPEPGKLCVEAAVCLVLGMPHGDRATGCIGAPDRALAIRLNDVSWSSDKARAEGLTEFAVAHLGSATMTREQRRRWTDYIVEQTIRRIVPIALRAAAQRNPKHAGALEAAAVGCEQEGTREAARQAAYAAAAAADAAAAYAAAAADAADAAAAAAAADADAAADYARDRVLSMFATIAVEAYALVRGE